MKVALSSKSPDFNVFNPLLKFYKKSGLDLNSPYPEYEKKAVKFLSNLDQKIQVMILESQFSPEHAPFEFKEFKNDDERYLWIHGFQNFYRAVNNIMNNYVPQSLGDEGAERQNTLKKEVFNPAGYNQPNIRPSRSSYSLLFE